MCHSIENFVRIGLLAVVGLAACGAEQSAAAGDAGGTMQAGHGDRSSQLMAAGARSSGTAEARARAVMSSESPSAGTRAGSDGAAAAGTAGATNSFGSAGLGGTRAAAVVAGSGASAANGSAGASAAAGGAVVSAASGGESGSLAAGSGAAQVDFSLIPVGLDKANDTELAFPADAINSVSISPEFMWSGVPPKTKSLALVFRDLSMSIVKWIVWDIPPSVSDLPKGISQDSGMLKEIPGAMQLGALGHQGYYGPCCTANHYAWVLWALDVEKLPVSAGQTTETIRDTIIAAHQLASTPPVLMRRVTP